MAGGRFALTLSGCAACLLPAAPDFVQRDRLNSPSPLDRCRPNLLIEILDRMSPGGIARISKSLGRFGYQGFYVRPNGLVPI